MRTTLNLDDQILAQVMALTGQKNRSEAVRIALQAYLKQQRKQELLALRGQVVIQDNWAFLRGLEGSQ